MASMDETYADISETTPPPEVALAAANKAARAMVREAVNAAAPRRKGYSYNTDACEQSIEAYGIACAVAVLDRMPCEFKWLFTPERECASLKGAEMTVFNRETGKGTKKIMFTDREVCDRCRELAHQRSRYAGHHRR